MTKYFSTAETAKMIRKALAESFPGIKFSVRSKTYSGGSSINVSWTDGPTAKMVDAIAGTFSGAYFDGMQDYKGSTYAMIDGETVKFGADFIFTAREHSDVLRAQVVAAYTRKYGVDPDANMHHYDVQREFNHMLHTRSAYLAPRASKTAGKVIYLGNDGYSQNGALSVD